MSESAKWKETGKRFFTEEIQDITERPLSTALNNAQNRCIEKFASTARTDCMQGAVESKRKKELDQMADKCIVVPNQPKKQTFKSFVKKSVKLTVKNNKEYGFLYSMNNINRRKPITPIIQGECDYVVQTFPDLHVGDTVGQFHTHLTHSNKHECMFSEGDLSILDSADHMVFMRELTLGCPTQKTMKILQLDTNNQLFEKHQDKHQLTAEAFNKKYSKKLTV